jgi:replicative DNA helicase
MFIYRAGAYNTTYSQISGNAPEDNTAQLIVAKQRNGPTGDVYLTFIKDYAKFEALAHSHYHHAAAQGD